MGCGKSSVGRKLSALLSCSYADLDAIIEENAGRPIPEIFASEGEKAFRRMELDALRDSTVFDLPPGATMVLALGGGTVMTPECAKLVHSHTICVYLRTSLEELVERLSCKEESSKRPMLNQGAGRKALEQRIATLMAQRSSTYEKTAHIIIDTDEKTVAEVAAEIVRAIR